MGNKKRVLIKYMALMLILLSALLLSACRTRITNNNEVSNVYYDEEGYLSETYEMRRSELGLTTAKKPILPDFGSSEDEEQDFDTGESFNYEPEEEEYVEPPEVQNANNNTNRSTTRTTNRTSSGSSSVTRRSRSSGGTNTSSRKDIEVTFDANGGKIKLASGGTATKTYNQYAKDEAYGSLPSNLERQDYTFKGWSKNKDGKTPVSKTDKVTSSHTLYAIWEQNKKPTPSPTPSPKPTPKPSTPEYTVRFDPGEGTWSDGSTEIKEVPHIEEGKTAKAPGTPKRKYFNFDGWDKSLENIKSNFTTKALWSDKTGEPLWDEKFSDAVDSSDYILYDVLEGNSTVLQDCKADKIKENESPDIAVIFSDSTNPVVIKELNNQLMAKYPKEEYPNVRRYIISTPKSGSKKELLYKINLLDRIHETDALDIEEAEEALDLNSDDVITITLVTDVIPTE